MRDYQYAVFIARVQPAHRAHIGVIERGLDKAENVIIVCGSDRSAPTVQNPWTVEEREQMIRRCFDYNTNKRIHVLAVRDQPYNNTNWLASIHQNVISVAQSDSVALIGHKKDQTSFYLDMFPQWNFLEMGLMYEGISATEIRFQYFSEGKEPSKEWKDRHWHNHVHDGVRDFLEEFRKTDRFASLKSNFDHIQNYKAQWAGSPFPPVFVTTDAIVVKSGHVLLIRRKLHPGKGLVALPGGFLQQGLVLVESMLNELKEETRIKVNKRDLREHIRDNHVFDLPRRSGRGRTITHGYYIKLPDGGILPEVRGADDAAEAFWCPIGDLRHLEREFFEDHLDIIEYFTNA